MGFTEILLVSVIIVNVLLVSRAQGAVHFTVVPPSTLYVSAGETAKLVWDYTVDNRSEEFDVFSPRWIFYADNDNAFQIAQESIFNNWEWTINPATCPTRLLNPVRVSKESIATLVIHNVTLADSGTYGCVLVLAARSPITSKVKLLVTSYPIITLHLSPPSLSMNASRAFFIICSAAGTPTPNVTWQTVRGKVIDQGVGKAILNISGIARKDSGIYKCYATNNPNKHGVCNITLISARYKPEFDGNKTFSLYNGTKITLRCNTSDVLSSQFIWNDTSRRDISRRIAAGSVLKLVTIDKDGYGIFKCKAEKFHGYEEPFNNVSQTVLSVPTSNSIDAKIVGTTSVAFSTEKVQQENAYSTTLHNTPVERNDVDKNYIIFLAAGGTVSFVLLTTIFSLAVLIYKKHSNNKDAEAQQRENEVPPLPLDTAETTMPVYATVDLSKKKRNRSQEDMPIYAQVDKRKKKRPHQIIYAELDEMHLAGVTSSATSPRLPKHNVYDEIDNIQNTSQTRKTDPIYACIQLE